MENKKMAKFVMSDGVVHVVDIIFNAENIENISFRRKKEKKVEQKLTV